MCQVFHSPCSYINRKLTCNPKRPFLCLLQRTRFIPGGNICKITKTPLTYGDNVLLIKRPNLYHVSCVGFFFVKKEWLCFSYFPYQNFSNSLMLMSVTHTSWEKNLDEFMQDFRCFCIHLISRCLGDVDIKSVREDCCHSKLSVN
jgi:hypothetical protein